MLMVVESNWWWHGEGLGLATHKDVGHLQSNQEEADTKMILHALDATANGATQLQIHSPGTDVFVLALRRF